MTIVNDVDARELAAQLREHEMPGARSATATTKLRRERARRNKGVPTPSMQQRLGARIVRLYGAEIEARGGETAIYDKSSPSGRLRLLDRRTVNGQRLYLLGVNGWRSYSTKSRSRLVSLRYLAGQDDAGPFAVRVAGTITTVLQALDDLTPAAVRDAQERGKRVRRQGDVYAIETTAAHDARTGPVDPEQAHHWNAQTRYLTHRPTRGGKHRPLRLSYPVRFVQQSTYGMERGAHGPGD